MTKEQRAELLRQRFKAKGGFAYVPTGKPRRYRHNISGRPVHMAWPQIIPDTKRAPGWMRDPNPAPTMTPQTKRNGGASPLTKIVEKQPTKPRRAFATAEAYLAAHKQR